MIKIYHVKYEDCTDLEPNPGWYVHFELKDGSERLIGHYTTRRDAVDLADQVDNCGGADEFFLG